MSIQQQALVNAIDFVQWVTVTTRPPISYPWPLADYPFDVWFSSSGVLTADLPKGIYAVDIETIKVTDDDWRPFCAVIYSFATGSYYYRMTASMVKFIDLPIAEGSLLIGHSITAYDRRYFSNEYLLTAPFQYLDTKCLAIRLRGISNQQVGTYGYLHSDYYEGDLPLWAEEHVGNDLDSLCQSYLGCQVDKGLRDTMVKSDLAYYVSKRIDILTYCARDVWYTSRLFNAIWAEAILAFHPQTIHASALLSGSRIPLDSVSLDNLIDQTSNWYSEVTEEVSKVLSDCLERAFKTYVEPWARGEIDLSQLPISYQSLDWTTKKSGSNKGLPHWYTVAKSKPATLSQKLSAILLGLRYQGNLVYFKKIGRSGTWVTERGEIPHPEGKGNLGDVFNKHHWALLGPGLPFTLDDPGLQSTLFKVKSLQFWKAFQSRVKATKRFTANGIHIPAYLPWGTVSGRSTDNLWLVSPKPTKDQPGSELRSTVRAPNGYRIVGGDFSSQEMRLFALIGDSARGRLGSSQLSQLLINGGCMHDALRDRSGAPRSVCKNINYGAIYGLGLKSAVIYCRLAGMDSPQTRAKAILDELKGVKTPSGSFAGGIASESFNAVAQAIKNPASTVSPILGNRLSKGLWSNDFLPSRQNWVVQVSGSDMRDLLVTQMNVLDPSYQLMLFVHDEPRYLVPLDKADQLAKDLQTCHQATMVEVLDRLGLGDVPDPYRYFDAIEIDNIWRKTADDPCLTPTQTVPIPPGITLKRPA